MKNLLEKFMGLILILGMLFIGQPVKFIHAYQEITTNETWSVYVNPTEDVVVRSGSTLTVEPGTTVLFQCQDDGNYPGSLDSARISIIVESGGTLEADDVLFAGEGYPGNDCWYGIEFKAGSLGYVRDSTIRDGVRGVHVESEIEISRNTIEYMKGRDGYDEIHPYGYSAYGIYVDADSLSPVIENNVIQRIYGGNGWNGPSGSYIRSGGAAYGIAVVDGAPHISGNTLQMIYGGDGADGSPGANGANGNNAVDLGADGEAGAVGGDGGNGDYAGLGAGIYLSPNADDVVISGNTIMTIRSGSSGNGGDGGDGGNGGNGALGVSGPSAGNGGNGGNGGDGGVGGNGAHAAVAYGIYSKANAVQIIGNSLSNIQNGPGGHAGDGGDGGAGGAGGTGGEASAGFGGNGGLGGLGGSGGQPGSVSGMNSSYLIYVENSTLIAFTGNIISGGVVVSSGPGANGGAGGDGGDGGDGGPGNIISGIGGNGGSGGNGANGGTPASPGVIYSVSLRTLNAVTEPLTNNIINEMTAHEAEPGGNAGDGGAGGNGGIGFVNGNGGDGGDGGIGGDGGNSGDATLITILNSSLDLVNNTFFKPFSPLVGENGGLAGVEGTGGTGNIPGGSGTAGTPGISGSNGWAFGVYTWEFTSSIPYTVNIYNSIFGTANFGNSLAIAKPGGSDLTVTSDYNDIWNWEVDYTGVTPGANDIDTNPLFVDSATRDFHLTETSGCIDAGNNNAPGTPDIDFDGNHRPIDGDGDMISTIDMGAFEFGAEFQIFLPLIMK